jgi:hypothetical protein
VGGPGFRLMYFHLWLLGTSVHRLMFFSDFGVELIGRINGFFLKVV